MGTRLFPDGTDSQSGRTTLQLGSGKSTNQTCTIRDWYTANTLACQTFFESTLSCINDPMQLGPDRTNEVQQVTVPITEVA